MDELRIPKIAVPIVGHTDQNEILRGEIFLERISSEGYSTRQVSDFFNSAEPFFPLRIDPLSNPVLIQKQSLVWVEFPDLYEEYRSDVSSSFAVKKKAVLHVKGVDPIHVQIIVDMPEDRARVLDLLNGEGPYIAMIIRETFVLFNRHAICRVDEP